MYDYDEGDIIEGLTCPKCKGGVRSRPECPTYYNRGIVYRCYPCCGNTSEYYCASEDCDWAYTEDLHPMNSRYDANFRNKPDWAKDNPAVA